MIRVHYSNTIVYVITNRLGAGCFVGHPHGLVRHRRSDTDVHDDTTNNNAYTTTNNYNKHDHNNNDHKHGHNNTNNDNGNNNNDNTLNVILLLVVPSIDVAR